MTKARDIASAAPAPSTVSATELGYLDGVTSAIQTQIDSKIGSASAISPTLIDAKGDLIVGSAADTAARLAVGTNDYVLTADSSATNGVKWAAVATPTYSGVRVRNSANQSIPNNTETVITFDTETFDEGGYHSTVSNTARLTVPSGKAGYYSIYFCMQWAPNATGIREVSLYINGTATRICFSSIKAPSATDYPSANGTTSYYLAENDYVQLTAYQDSGNALNITNSPTISFGMDKVG